MTQKVWDVLFCYGVLFRAGAEYVDKDSPSRQQFSIVKFFD